MKASHLCAAATAAAFSIRETMAFRPAAVAAVGMRTPANKMEYGALRSTTIDVVSTADDDTGDTEVPFTQLQAKKDQLLQVAQRLKNEYGLFLVDSSAKQQLKTAVEALESESTPPSTWTEDMWGDWELVCTTATNADGVDTSKIPFFDAGPLKQIRDAVRKTTNKYLTVTQRIRSVNDGRSNSDTKDESIMERPPTVGSATSLNRIDHVLEYRPPTVLRDVLDDLPEQLTAVNINPLQVSKSKLVLVHKASVVSPSTTTTSTSTLDAALKIQLSLTSIVLNVAGTSTFLDPSGQDVSSLNLPLGEFMNAGTFTTTYVDDNVRISRGAQGLVDQLRVFVRSARNDGAANSARGGVTSKLDVDDTMDPEFGNIQSPSDVED